MEGTESKPPKQQEDSHIRSMGIVEVIEEFQESVKDIIEEIKQDEGFSEMTAENYDKKKSYLTKHLTDLSHLHRMLANQHVRLIEVVSKNFAYLIKYQHLDSFDINFPHVIKMLSPYQDRNPRKLMAPIGYDFALRASGGGFNICKRERLESASSLSSDSGSESTNKLLGSTVKNGALEVKETKALKFLVRMTSNVVDEPISDTKLLENEVPKLNQKFLELQKQVGDLKLVILESELKIKTVEEELETSRKRLTIAMEAIANLKGEQSTIKPVPDDALKVEESNDSGLDSPLSSVNKPPVSPVSDDASKVNERKDSYAESSMASDNKPAVPPVINDALKVEQTKDSGSESSMSSVNKHAAPPVNDDFLLEKNCKLEEELASLKQKLQSLTEENGELKQQINGNVADVELYMSESKLGWKALEEEVLASKELAKKIEENMCGILSEKASNESKRDTEIKAMNMKMAEYMTEISQLKSAHEKKERIWNGVTEQLKNDLKEKCELVDELSQKVSRKDDQLEILWDEKLSQDTLIQELKTELHSVKLENQGVLQAFDNVHKLTDELKQKVVELEREVRMQTEAMSDQK